MNMVMYVIYLVLVGTSSGLKIRDEEVVNLTLGLAQEVVFQPHSVTPVDIHLPEDDGEGENITTRYAFYSAEIHAYGFPLILESTEVTRSSSVERFDGGLLIPVVANKTMRVYVTNNHRSKVFAVSLARGVAEKDPIPGKGPAASSAKEIRPNVHISWNDFVTTIRFREAGSLQSLGSGNIYEYEVYQFWLPEGDFQEDDFVSGLSSMLFAKDIRQNGFPVGSYYLDRNFDTGFIEATFSSFPNTFQLFAVIVTSQDGEGEVNEAVYTFAVTACCDMRVQTSQNKTKFPSWSCSVVYHAESGVLVGLCLCLGAFLVCFGHRCLTGSQFIFGAFTAGLAGWAAAIGLFHFGHLWAMVSAVCFGFFAGLLNLVISNFRRLVFISTAVANALNGLLVGATVVHIANLCQSRAMMSDFIFFGTLSAVGSVYFLCTIGFRKWAHLVSCCSVGSFAFACCLDHYLGSTVRYILLNFLRRCSDRTYRNICPQLPFQDNEKIVVSVWAVLALVPFVFQIWRYRRRTPFNPLDDVVAVEVTPVNMLDDERTPLLPGGQGSENPGTSRQPEDEGEAARQEVVGYIEGYGAVTAPPPQILRIYSDPRLYADRDIRNSPSRPRRRPWRVASLFQRSSQESSQQQSTRGPVRDIFRPPDMNSSPT